MLLDIVRNHNRTVYRRFKPVQAGQRHDIQEQFLEVEFTAERHPHAANSAVVA